MDVCFMYNRWQMRRGVGPFTTSDSTRQHLDCEVDITCNSVLRTPIQYEGRSLRTVGAFEVRPKDRYTEINDHPRARSQGWMSPLGHRKAAVGTICRLFGVQG